LYEDIGAPIPIGIHAFTTFKRFSHALAGVCHGEQESDDEHG
jgi:hypothetical protein